MLLHQNIFIYSLTFTRSRFDKVSKIRTIMLYVRFQVETVNCVAHRKNIVCRTYAAYGVPHNSPVQNFSAHSKYEVGIINDFIFSI